MDVASETIKQVVQVLMVPVKKHLGYMISYRKYVEDMHTKMGHLDLSRAVEKEHFDRNTRTRLEVSNQVGPWLEKVENIKAKVENIPSEDPGCLDFKSRHKLGSKASKIIKEIDSVTTQHSLIQWTDLKIPPGRIDSLMASTSTPSGDHNDFQSRGHTFTEALKALGPDHKSHMVALWGMGGVGKTTMMKKLKEVVVRKKMFDHYVEAVIGEKTDPIAIQQAVAEYLGIELTETTKPARTEQLRKWFANNSDGGKKKFLVILDDVWQFVDLEDIGLSPSPNQGVDFKVLLTSRKKDVCIKMGVEADSILSVEVLKDAEAQSFFRQILKSSDDADLDPALQKIGDDIASRCQGLPIAIKTIAYALKGNRKHVWEDALSRLEHNDLDEVVKEVFTLSYNNLQDKEAESIFLLCGLFPEDFNIPIEDLMRYGWGLKFFNRVDSIREARNRLNTCIDRLIHTNLLIKSYKVGCVKMHDLVRAFVLDMLSKAEHASIVNHGSSKPGWPETEKDVIRTSCKRISLTCKGMTEFPSDLKFPNVSILKLMHGDKSMRFPRNFYEEMGKLQVISYYHMEYPLLFSSLECSTNIRVLRLHQCLLKFGLSSVGKLLNLEVLSFAESGIKSLPSTIGNLKKLRVLDVTGCGGLCIDNGVFKKLVRLEELYAYSFDRYGRAISFTGDNCNEVAERWKNISALEFDFYENDSQWKNLSFENLEQFKISVGRSLKGEDDFMKRKISFKNTLKLVIKKGEVSRSRINELFEKTEVLCLSVDDMHDLEDIGVKSSLCSLSSSFCNLRILVVSECAELEYLFTLSVAKVVSNLEHLEVFNCLVMKELIHLESGGEERVTFPNLKFLSLSGLPELLDLCRNVNIIDLPKLVELKVEGIPNITSIYSKNKPATSCLLREEVLIPKLEKLYINGMENLKEIWPCDFRTSEEVKLREIQVSGCKNLVNLFPCNPMPLLRHLEELNVWNCGSIKALFNINLDCVAAIEKGSISLRRIDVFRCHELVDLFPCNPMPFLCHLEELKVRYCSSIEALFNIHLDCVAADEKGSISSRRIEVDNCGKLVNLFLCNPMPLLQHLEILKVRDCGSIEALFNIDLDRVAAIEKGSISLRRINVIRCGKLVNLFPCNPMPFLHHLEELQVDECGSIEALFNIDMDCVGETGEGGSSSLRRIEVEKLGKLQEVWRIKGENHSRIPIRGFQAVESISIKFCRRFRNVFSPTSTNFDLDLGALTHMTIYSGETGQENSLFPTCLIHSFHNLRKLELAKYEGVEVIFEMKSTPTSQDNQERILPYLENLEIKDMKRINHVWKCNWNEFLILHREPSESPFHNLRTIKLEWCERIKYLFSPLMAKLLSNLKEVKIRHCYGMEEVVSNRDDEEEEEEKITSTSTSTSTHTASTTLFPLLDSLTLHHLQNLKCIGGAKAGNNEISFSSTTTTTSFLDQYKFSQVDGVSWTLCQYPREISITKCHALSSVIPWYAAGQMQKLQVLKIESCGGMKEVFETRGINKSVITLKLPNLKKLEISDCGLLEYIFTFSALESLVQLEELRIEKCKAMKVIVVKEEDDGVEKTTKASSSKPVVKFPCLKSIELQDLPELVGFFLGTNEFQWPSLDDLVIKDCPEMKVFTAGGSTAPQLKYVETRSGKYSPPECWFNSHHVTTTATGQQHQETPCQSLERRSSSFPAATTSEEIINIWPFHNLIELDMSFDPSFRKKIVPSNELIQLQKLEKFRVKGCGWLEEVFEALEGTNSSGFDESQTTTLVKIPNLTQVELGGLDRVRHIWKSNRCTVFEFPNLTRVDISNCNSLEHVFSSSMVGSLLQLQDLQITNCKNMEEVFVVVEKEESDGKTNEIVFPRLTSLNLYRLECLKGFCLGKVDFSFPLLDTLTIMQCPTITTFTTGNSSTPELEGIETGFGWFYVEEDINSFIKMKQQEFKRDNVKSSYGISF